MPRLLILGGGGMLGHRVWLAARTRADAWITLRGPLDEQPGRHLFDPGRSIEHVDALDPDRLCHAFAVARPQVVINCIGVVKQLGAAHDPLVAIPINALFPHRLAGLCAATAARLIQVSTDCVFSGSRGRYTESDSPDPVDLYGRTKLLGEVVEAPHVTFRTSMVGRELGRATGLFEWFLAQRGPVTGYRRAIFSGLTTSALASALLDFAIDHPDLRGLYHLAVEPIDKYSLLVKVRDTLGLSVEIIPDEAVGIDRSLDATRLCHATGWTPPSWDDMLTAFAAEQPQYTNGRTALVS